MPPTVVGAIREATGGWTVPLVATVVALVVLTVAGLAATGPAPEAVPRTAPDGGQ